MEGSENNEPTTASMEGTDQVKDASKRKKKSPWGFDGLKKWKKASNEEATSDGERSECTGADGCVPAGRRHGSEKEGVLTLVIVSVISIAVRKFGRFLRELSHQTHAVAA